jgi:hypothetical protein
MMISFIISFSPNRFLNLLAENGNLGRLFETSHGRLVNVIDDNDAAWQ